jgi:cobalt-zinc-cadmium efflux system membrane fusion protein
MFKNKHFFQAALLAVCVIGGILLGMKISPAAGEVTHSNPTAAVSAPTDPHASHEHAKESPTQSTATDWCAEHRYPESECTVCQPELIAKFKADGNWCSIHNAPETNCRPCNPTLTFPQEPREPITAEPVKMSVFFPTNRAECASDQAVIRFATAKTADRIGLLVEPVVNAESAPLLEAPAEIVLDETRVRAVTIAIPATVTRWLVEPGEMVALEQPLAELQSPEMASLKSQYLTAVTDWTRDHQQWKRANELHQNQMISQAEMDEYEAREKSALSHFRGLEAQLKSLGLSRQDIDSLSSRHDADGNWLLRAGHSAAVIERRAALGERLDAGSTLAMIGDPTALWIQAHVREQDLARFKVGQEIVFTADGESLSRAQGEVIWVSQYLEPETRTGIVRARVTDSNDRLRAHTFGRAHLKNTDRQEALLVAKDAVQWEGCCNIVFVQEAIDRYRPTKVTIDRGSNRHYRVESGLQEGDLVVTAGSFLLKTELKKGSLGVGCAGE